MIRRKTIQRIGIVVALLFAAACEKVEIPTSGGDNGGEVPKEEPDVEIEGTGEGSMIKPFTVMDVLQGEVIQQGKQCWVMGYVVGYTRYSMNNADFTAQGAVQSNVLLADNPQEDDLFLCVPVELNTDKLHKNVSLAYNADSIGRRIMVEGLVMEYFKVTGLRQVKAYRWLGELQIPDEEGGDNPPPEEDEEEQPQPKPETPDETIRDTVGIAVDGEHVTGGRVAHYKYRLIKKNEPWR